MNISVVGYQGFIGSAMIRAIESAGLRPNCVGRNDEIEPNSDLVIDCNGNSSKFQTNANPSLGQKEIVESVSDRLNQVQKFTRYVYISSGEVYGNEQNNSKEIDLIHTRDLSYYGQFKFQAEELVKKHLRNHLIIRPSGFVGQGLKKNPIFDLLNKSQIFVHEESQFQFCDVDWFADAVVSMALTDFVGVLNISSSGSVSIKEIIGSLKIQTPLIPGEANIEIHKLSTDLLSTFIEVPSTSRQVQSFIAKVTGENE
jgi:nucleoside-diphosphate-sugar epimerase